MVFLCYICINKQENPMEILLENTSFIVIMSVVIPMLLFIIYIIVWSQYAIHIINKYGVNGLNRPRKKTSIIGISFFVNQRERRLQKKYYDYFIKEVERRETLYPVTKK